MTRTFPQTLNLACDIPGGGLAGSPGMLRPPPGLTHTWVEAESPTEGKKQENLSTLGVQFHEELDSSELWAGMSLSSEPLPSPRAFPESTLLTTTTDTLLPLLGLRMVKMKDFPGSPSGQGQDPTFPNFPGTQVQSLLGELRSHMLHTVTKKQRRTEGSFYIPECRCLDRASVSTH